MISRKVASYEYLWLFTVNYGPQPGWTGIMGKLTTGFDRYLTGCDKVDPRMAYGGFMMNLEVPKVSLLMTSWDRCQIMVLQDLAGSDRYLTNKA